MDKHPLLTDLLGQVRSDVEKLTRLQQDTRDGATHDENRAESSKDTRATEQSYLARGLAERVEKLRDAELRLTSLSLRSFDADEPVALGAVVRLRDETNDANEFWWMVPVGGGLELQWDGERIRTVTPGSPLGRALIGLQIGDEGVYQTPRGERRFEIFEIL